MKNNIILNNGYEVVINENLMKSFKRNFTKSEINKIKKCKNSKSAIEMIGCIITETCLENITNKFP